MRLCNGCWNAQESSFGMWYLQVSSPGLISHLGYSLLQRTLKVKCDDLKPVCQRCRSTGCVCEGYGIWGGGGNGYDRRYGAKETHVSPLNHRPPASTIKLNNGYQEHLKWFHHRLVPDLSSRLAEGFWTALIMSAMLSEPVIAHEAIALSVAHRDAASTSNSRQVRNAACCDGALQLVLAATPIRDWIGRRHKCQSCFGRLSALYLARASKREI